MILRGNYWFRLQNLRISHPRTDFLHTYMPNLIKSLYSIMYCFQNALVNNTYSHLPIGVRSSERRDVTIPVRIFHFP